MKYLKIPVPDDFMFIELGDVFQMGKALLSEHVQGGTSKERGIILIDVRYAVAELIDDNPLPPPPDPVPTFPFAFEVIAANGLNLREQASSTSAKISPTPYPRGTIFEATTENTIQTTTYEWLLVTYQDAGHNINVSGYIAIKNLRTGEVYAQKVRG